MTKHAPVHVAFYAVVGQFFKQSRGYTVTDGKPTVRLTKTPPALEPQEVAVYVSLDLPASLFLRPALSASIKVEDGQAPATITPTVMSNIADVVREQLGIVMDVRAAEVQP